MMILLSNSHSNNNYDINHESIIVQTLGLYLVLSLHTFASIKVLDWWKEMKTASVAGPHVHMQFAGNEERSWHFTPQKVETKMNQTTATCSNLTRQNVNMCECFFPWFSMFFSLIFPPGYLLHTFCLLILVPALKAVAWHHSKCCESQTGSLLRMTICQQNTCATMQPVFIHVIKRLIHII